MGDDSAVASSAVLSFRRVSRAIAIVVIPMTGLTGCLGAQDTGDIRLSTGGAELCAPAKVGESLVIGDVAELASGVTPQTLLGAELIDADGIELVEVAVLPFADDGGSIGTMSLDNPNANWEQRVDVKGAVVDEEHANIVVTVRRTGTEVARAEGIRLEYEGAWRPSYAESNVTFTLEDSCS